MIKCTCFSNSIHRFRKLSSILYDASYIQRTYEIKKSTLSTPVIWYTVYISFMFCILLLTWWTGSLLQRMRNVKLSLLLEMFMSERKIIFRTNTNFVLIIQFNKHFRFRPAVTICACKDFRRCFWNDISALHECWNTNISWLIQSNSISSILSGVFEVNLEVSGWILGILKF